MVLPLVLSPTKSVARITHFRRTSASLRAPDWSGEREMAARSSTARMYDAIRTLVGFLVDDCCDGHPELCHLQEAIDEANFGCGPKKKSGGRSRGK